MSWVEFAAAVTSIIAVPTLLIGVGTLWKAVIEYRRQNISKRFEIFQDMNARFDAEPFRSIREKLDHDEASLAIYDYTSKHNFIAFFEEIALSVNSRIMNDDVAFYIFGYYAIKTWCSENFWRDERMLGKQSEYWSLYREFTGRMFEKQRTLTRSGLDPHRMRF